MLQGYVSASNTLFELYLITYTLKDRAVGDGGGGRYSWYNNLSRKKHFKLVENNVFFNET